MTQAQPTSELLIPPVLTLRVTPQIFELIRGQLGKLPHDEIGGLCQNLEAQAQEQIRAYNEPKAADLDSKSAAANSPVGRAVRRAAAKKGGNATPLKGAKLAKRPAAAND